MTLLTHVQAAELLFAAGLLPPPDIDAAVAELLITEQYTLHHGVPARFADELATEYGRSPQTAAAHMAACLAAAPDSVELPDRGPTTRCTPQWEADRG